MSNLVLLGVIGLMAVKGKLGAHSTPQKTPRHLCFFLFAALWMTATAHAQSTAQTTEQLEQQVQQLQNLVQQLQLRV